MKWSIMVTAGALQVNLEPENEHEREVMKILAAHGGPAELHHGVSVTRCQGGYLRDFGEDAKTLAITITKADGV